MYYDLFAQDGGHKIAAVVVVRRVSEGFFARETCSDRIVAEDVRKLDSVSHGFYAIGVHLTKLIDVADDLSQLWIYGLAA